MHTREQPHHHALKDPQVSKKDALPRQLPGVFYTSRPLRPEEWIARAEHPIHIDDLFCDGVHPSSLTYRYWCQEIVETVPL